VQRVLHEDTIERDLAFRDPNEDDQLGIRREHLSRAITGDPNAGTRE
jgi:hypothetical protein